MDRRAYLKTVGAASGAVAVAGCQGTGSNDTIVPGTASGFPPFEFTQDGELVGFDIDLATEVVDRTEFELGEWTDIEFDQLESSLINGDIDLVAAAVTITEARQENSSFSDPYWESNQAVLVAEGGEFSPESTDDLEGQVVGAQGGTTGADQVQGLVDDGVVAEDDFLRYDNYTLAVQDLENGNVDAVVIDIPVAETFAANRDVTVAFVIETNEQFGFRMREDDDRVEAINEGLTAVMDDGTYEELVQKWFGSDS